MQQHIDYQTPAAAPPDGLRVPPWLWRTGAALWVMAAVVVFAFLQSLVHAPYRPPFDMSPLLGVGDLEKVRAFQVVCIVLGGVPIFWLWANWHRRRSAAA
jgi:hypothetical protein